MKEGPEYNVYDPFEAELQYLKKIGVGEIELDFNNPNAARFLTQQLTVRLLELRETKLSVETLRSRNESFRDEIEELKVSNGKLTEKDRFSWIEFPAGILSGIAGNLIVADKSNFLAWSLLLLGIVIFATVRLPQISAK